MKQQLQSKVLEIINDLHSNDLICSKIYDAIESYTNDDFIYHRDLLKDCYENDNEILFENKGSILFYQGTNVEYNLANENESTLEMLIGDLKQYDNDLEFLKQLVIESYRAFLLRQYTAIMCRYDRNMESILENLH